MWNGEGLPPVGDTVEYSAIDYDFSKPSIENGNWYRGKIIAYYDGCVWTSDNGIRSLGNTAFRPIKSDRDKAIEEIAVLWSSHMSNNKGLTEFFGGIYDAGFHKITKE